MKCSVPEISWHNRDPVLSLDIHHSKTSREQYRIASGGNDSHVVVRFLSLVFLVHLVAVELVWQNYLLASFYVH